MPELPQTRQSLLIRLRQRSDDAWLEFLKVYEQAIFDYSRRRGLQDADALDVTQDVLAAVTTKIEKWQNDPTKGKFRGWLFRVARNIAVDKVIEQAKRAARGGDSATAVFAEQPDTLEKESTVFWNDYRRKLIHWAAEQIKPEVKETSWQSFWSTAIEGKSAESVAQEMGVSVGTVYAAKFRIVTRIRKLVARFDDTEHSDEELWNDFRNRN